MIWYSMTSQVDCSLWNIQVGTCTVLVLRDFVLVISYDIGCVITLLCFVCLAHPIRLLYGENRIFLQGFYFFEQLLKTP